MGTRVLHGREFLKILQEAGVIGDKVRRVVIDAPFDGAVVIYTEELGGLQLLNMRPAEGLIEARLKGVDDANNRP